MSLPLYAASVYLRYASTAAAATVKGKTFTVILVLYSAHLRTHAAVWPIRVQLQYSKRSSTMKFFLAYGCPSQYYCT